MSYSHLSEFYSNINKYDLARNYLFDVKFAFPHSSKYLSNILNYSKDLSFSCYNAELPGRTFGLTEQKIYGAPQKFPTNSSYNDITLDFICRDKDFIQKKIFDYWFDIINPSGNSSETDFNFTYKKDYVSNIIITQYSQTSEELYKVELIDAFPFNMNQIELDWGMDSYTKLSVTFAYYKWIPRSVHSGINQVNFPKEDLENNAITKAIAKSQQTGATSSLLADAIRMADTGYNLNNAIKSGSFGTGIGIAASTLPGLGVSAFNLSSLGSKLETNSVIPKY